MSEIECMHGPNPPDCDMCGPRLRAAAGLPPERWENIEDGCLIEIGADGCGVTFYPKGNRPRGFARREDVAIVRTGKHWRRVQ